VPTPTDINTAKIGKLELFVATFEEGVRNIRRDLDRVEIVSNKANESVQDLDKRLTVLIRDAEQLEKKLDDLHARRWELWKIILAGALGSLLTLAVTLFNRTLDRPAGVAPAEREPAATRPK
jgi:hypothetical protein